MKPRILTALATIAGVGVALVALAGPAAASLPGTHVAHPTVTCTSAPSPTVTVTFPLKNVPAGVSYLAVVNGPVQRSQSGTTTGAEAITVAIPVASCPALCGATVDTDVSLTGADIAEDSPFLGVAVTCPTLVVTPPTPKPQPKPTPKPAPHVVTPAPTPAPVGHMAIGTAISTQRSLPNTGSHTTRDGLVGLAAVLGGLGLVAVARRRPALV